MEKTPEQEKQDLLEELMDTEEFRKHLDKMIEANAYEMMFDDMGIFKEI